MKEKKNFSNKKNKKNNFEKKSFSSRKILLHRYDKFFGFRTSQKLLESMKMFSNNQFIRFNFSKTNRNEIDTFLKKNRVKTEDTFLKNGIKINKSFFNLTSSLFGLSSKFYTQDLASQVPINCIDFERLKNLGREVKILDSCASPGSKTTQLLDLLNFNNIPYEVLALEPEVTRLNRLINNIQKHGFDNFKVLNVEAQKFKTGILFDVIICDVPCSGNLVGDKDWLGKRTVSGICELSNLQKSIVKNLWKYLRKEGELIYSTCSLEVEENEKNVEWILDNTELKNIKINLKTGFDSKPVFGVEGLRFMPFKSKTQGFFVSKFVR